MKQFAGWLVRTKRLVESPLSPIRRFNVQTDRRHDRRPLSADELFWLVHAAETGPDIESIPGPDRAVMYVLAAWTGLRKGEIGSLTPQSFDFDSEPPTVTVMAMFSKRKRHDTQVLHPCVAERLRAWLIRRRGSAANILLFPVSGKVPGGVERKTHKMMERDLAAGRLKWLDTMKDDNALSDEERGERERSDFLKYRDSQGRFADFHSNRHTFITNLGRAGVSPKTAQELARHSDIRLTIGIYSHSDLAEKVDAVRRLPSPTWLNGNGTTAVPEEPRVSLPENGSAQRLGSAPKSQASTNGHLASEGVQDKTTSAEPKGSAEVVVPSAVAARRRKQSPTDSNIPGKIRTCNLRLRSAMMACG